MHCNALDYQLFYKTGDILSYSKKCKYDKNHRGFLYILAVSVQRHLQAHVNVASIYLFNDQQPAAIVECRVPKSWISFHLHR